RAHAPGPLHRCPNVTSLLEQFAASTPLAGGNADYVEALYERYLGDPDSVSPQWRRWFDTFKGREAGDRPHAPIVAEFERLGRLNGRASALPAPAPGTIDVYAERQA